MFEDEDVDSGLEQGDFSPFEDGVDDAGAGEDADGADGVKVSEGEEAAGAGKGEGSEVDGEKDKEGKDETEEDGTEDGADKVEMFPVPVNVMGEDRQFSMSQAVQALQDSVLMPLMARDLSLAQSNPVISFVEEQAELAGMDVAEFITQQRTAVQMSELVAEYGDLENVPASILNLHAEKVELQTEKIRQELAQRKSQEQVNEFERFAMVHPEVKVLPDEVIKLVGEGKSIEDAWNVSENKRLAQENEALREQLAISVKNNQNKTKQTPKVNGIPAKAADDDLEWE